MIFYANWDPVEAKFGQLWASHIKAVRDFTRQYKFPLCNASMIHTDIYQCELRCKQVPTLLIH